MRLCILQTKLNMNTKYLIALLFLIATAQSAIVAVGDSEQFVKATFSNLIAVPGVVLGQKITASVQFNDIQGDQIYIEFYQKGTTPAAANRKSCTSVTCSVEWDSTITTVSGTYELRFSFKTKTSLIGNKVTVGSLTLTGNAASRSNQTLIKQTVVVSDYKMHKLYFSAPTTLTISLPYTTIEQRDYYMQTTTTADPPTGVTVTNTIRAFSEDSTTSANAGKLTQIAKDTPSSGTNPAYSGAASATSGTVTWTFKVSGNYTWIAVDASTFFKSSGTSGTAGTAISWSATRPFNFRMNYFTEIYTCPFISEYPDSFGIFRGCLFQTDLSRLPCILYNSVINTCQACYTGYTLNGGKCVQQDCPAGQYKRYGQCLPNPAGCDTYNDFTKCTKCSTGFNLNNGVCEKAPLTCTGRTFFNKATWTCDKVDDNCKEWTTDTGACTSCLSSVEKPVAGKCTPIEKICTDKQYVNAALECVDIDPLCQTFEKFGGKCIKCVWGYEFNAAQGKCVKIVCPSRFVPNDFGKCVRVSDLCDQFDARGTCLACIPTHALQSNGVCLQIEKPYPCPSRQYLGDDNFCHQVNEFCEIYNKETGACTQCVGNYFLMYTGECVLQKQCKSRQVLINNDCQDVSPTCGNFDRKTGKCLNCASEDYELYYGLCIPVSTCGVRQWTDDNKNCFDVSPRCNTFNPSTGDCTSCVQGYNFLNGVCCLKGQFNSNGKCVDAKDASQVSNQDGCRTFVNGIGCVRCDDNFVRTQDNFGFYFCKSA